MSILINWTIDRNQTSSPRPARPLPISIPGRFSPASLGHGVLPRSVAAIRNGRSINLPEFSDAPLVKVFANQHLLIAVVQRIAGTLFQPRVVLFGSNEPLPSELCRTALRPGLTSVLPVSRRKFSNSARRSGVASTSSALGLEDSLARPHHQHSLQFAHVPPGLADQLQTRPASDAPGRCSSLSSNLECSGNARRFLFKPS